MPDELRSAWVTTASMEGVKEDMVRLADRTDRLGTYARLGPALFVITTIVLLVVILVAR